MQATIQKWGNSHAVRLPKNLLDSLGLHENDIVNLSTENNQITIRKAKRHRTLQERFQDYPDSTICPEFNWSQNEEQNDDE